VQGQARIVEALEDAGYSPDDYVPPEDYAEALSRAVKQRGRPRRRHEDIIVPTDPFAAAMIGLLIGLSAAEQDNSSPAEG
jgi:hypothetical protein